MSQQPWNNPANQQGGAPDPWSQEGSQTGGSDSWGMQSSGGDEPWRSAPPPASASSAPYGDSYGAQGSASANDAWGQQGASMPTMGTNPYTGAQQPYAQPQPYGAMPYGATPYGNYGGTVDDPQSKRGLTSLILSGSALVISLVLSWICAQGYIEVLSVGTLEEMQNGQLPAGMEGAVAKMMVGLFGQIIPTGLGIAGLVVAITGMKFPSQRSLSVIGLIIAIAAPIVSFIFWMVTLAPIMDKLS